MIKFLQSLTFSEDEINYIAQQFFGKDGKFNAEQINVISCFSKENIQACPGSGKTTTLAAKLLLLQKYIQNQALGGICILTHTNVAVDIIKKRLGNEGSAFYSNYPNYLGTIQSFVNRFLAIPAFRQIYQSGVQAIDDDIYFSMMGRRQVREARNAVPYLSRSKQIDHLGVLSFNIHNFDISANVADSNPIVQKTTNSYKEVERLKNSILSEGFLKFDEAYSLSFRHLREHPSIIPVFSKRFPVVFLDEMQDTEHHQFALLDKIFGQNSIFQTIGDGNQDIYGHYEEIKIHWPPSRNYSIATSSRFPQVIADTVQKVAVEPQTLVGNTNTPLPTHIIVFDDATIANVKKKFGELIITNRLHEIPDCSFKAVGGRKDAERLSVKSYFDNFNKISNKIREHYSTLDDYLNALQIAIDKSSNTREFKNIIVLAILEMLKLLGIKDEDKNRSFTGNSFERYLKNADESIYLEYRRLIAKAIGNHIAGIKIKRAITQFVSSDLMSHFLKTPTIGYAMFIESTAEMATSAAKIKHNTCEVTWNDTEVDIVFDTIHAVKGETHTATLYLETYNRAYDVEKLLPLINSTQKASRTFVNSNKKRMTQGFVAMSRPTHLLCIAVHQSRINLAFDWNSIGIEISDC